MELKRLEELRKVLGILIDDVSSEYFNNHVEVFHRVLGTMDEILASAQRIPSKKAREAIELIKEQQDGWRGTKTWELYELAVIALRQMDKNQIIQELKDLSESYDDDCSIRRLSHSDSYCGGVAEGLRLAIKEYEREKT